MIEKAGLLLHVLEIMNLKCVGISAECIQIFTLEGIESSS